MTEKPLLVNRARDWIAKARSLHQRQLTKQRRVRRLGNSRLTFTKGQAVTTASSFFVAGSTQSAGLPDWTFWGVLIGGVVGGKYLFPVPNSSIASRQGPADVVPKNVSELDNMVPEEIRAYEHNMFLKYRLTDPKGLGTALALQRQQEAARTAEETAGLATGSLSGLSFVDAHTFSATAAKHELLRRRWLAYEVDPKLQFDFPEMSDVAFPATAAMIEAMRKADQAKSECNTANYWSAVAAFGWALTVAEAAAGVQLE